MSEWKNYCIGDLCSTISNTYNGSDDKVVLINTSDVLDGKVLNHNFVENKNLKGQFKKTFIKNDILYSEIRPANKRFAFIDFDKTNNYIVSTKLMVLRPDTTKVLPSFLFSILKSQTVIDELQHLAETRSGTFPQITFSSELAPMKVLLPNLDIQAKIVSILNSIEEKISTNTAINNNLEQQAMALFTYNFIDNSNENRISCKAEEYFDISIGKTPPRKEPEWFSVIDGVKWVSISDMGNCGMYISNSSEYLTPSAIDKYNVKIVPDNTVILSFKLTVGRVAITVGEMTTNEAIAHFKTDNKKINEYLYCYLKKFNYQTMGSTSSIATAVNSKIIKAMLFVIPTDDEINKFHTIVKPIFNQIKLNQIENSNLIQLRDTILPKLMSGEIDVSEVDISTDKLLFSEDK